MSDAVALVDSPAPGNQQIAFTIFPDVGAKALEAKRADWEAVVDKLREPAEYPSKAACPLIKLARFGDERSDKDSLRHDSNVIEITGLEADYDGEQMPIAEAAMLLHEHGITAALYTSPSHTPDRPRWRVLAPLSHPYPPQERKRFLARLNGALGGVLAAESFTLSQSYYVGRVNGSPYDVQQVHGRCIDLLDELDERAVYPERAASAGDTRAERLSSIRSDDPVILRLTERGLVKRHRSDGGVDIGCPFADRHTTPGGAGDTTYWPPHTGGYPRGHFHCLHSHCAGREDAQFLAAIGLGEAKAQPQTKAKTEEFWPAALDLETLAEREPEPAQFVVQDWLPTGYATLFAGHGGVGKSGIALHLAVCVAAGIPFFGLDVQRRRVLYASCEDRENILHWRLTRICAHLGIDLAKLRGWLEVVDLVGKDTILWERDPQTGLTLTRGYYELQARVQQYGTQVLMLDGVSDTYGGNENAKPEVKRYVNACLALVPADSGALLLIGHIAKPAASNPNTSEGYSGSTGWHNAVRARWYLYPETEEASEENNGRQQRTGNLILEQQKSNFGPIDQSIPFAWDGEAKMHLAKETTRFDRTYRDTQDRDAVLRAIEGCARAGIIVPASRSGSHTTLHVLRERPEFPKALGSSRAGRGRFWRHIEQLRQFGSISEQERRKADRHLITVFVPTGKALEVRQFGYDTN